MSHPWNNPGEHDKLYPGLSVNDHRVNGSINVGNTRLSLWAFLPGVVRQGWEFAVGSYSADEYGWNADACAAFVGNLLEQRGDFARLLLVLADVERRERKVAWWDKKADRKRVAEALRRCLAVVEDEPS